MKIHSYPILSIVITCSVSLLLSSCTSPEHTSRAVTGTVLGAAAGGLMGGRDGAWAGAAIGGLLGYATATGDPKYGTYPGRSRQSGNTNSSSSGSMGYRHYSRY
jgi:hypothetical protein